MNDAETSDLQERFLNRVRDALRAATLDDFLSFLTVRAIADGASAQFYEAFPNPKDSPRGGRDGLIDALKDQAAPTDIATDAPVTAQTSWRLVELVPRIGGRDDAALEDLLDIAVDDFDGYFSNDDSAAADVLNQLMVAAARSDPDARDRVASYYKALTSNYASIEGMLLTVLNREPIPALGSAERFATVITALYDGLAIRARIDDPQQGDSARDLLRAVLIPIIAALSVPVGEATPSHAEMLFGSDGAASNE
jgi:hypothetical protein